MDCHDSESLVLQDSWILCLPASPRRRFSRIFDVLNNKEHKKERLKVIHK